ncbi:MAG: GtrA family protein [Gammaproteobacteria bacterium]|nr:MAG: GtrA family protein [Gammaproteobacteria bacterium]
MLALLKQFAAFAGTGAIATGIQYLLLILLKELGGLPPPWASAIGYAVAAFFNYLMKYHWVFASDRRHKEAAPRYALVSASGLTLNTALMYLFTEVLEMFYLLAQVITTALVLVWNFTINRYWTFATRNN